MRTRKALTLALTVALIALSAASALASEFPAALRACTTERDDARRLACFDREAAVLLQQPAAGAESAPLTAEQRFGLGGKLAAGPENKPPPALKELKAKVAGVSLLPRGEFVVTLDNSQVWIEEPPAHHLELAAGDQVTLIPGVLGSFFLAASSGRGARVKRVR